MLAEVTTSDCWGIFAGGVFIGFIVTGAFATYLDTRNAARIGKLKEQVEEAELRSKLSKLTGRRNEN